MGLAGIWTWMCKEVDKLKTLRSMTTDAEQLKILDEVIANLESKKGE